MEGIIDGRARDDCFVCGLLWPETEDCPRCRHRLSWQPAMLADELDVLARVARGWDTWKLTEDSSELETLLEALHRLAPASLEALAMVGGDLDQLRRAWRQAEPNLSPALAGDPSMLRG